jgi:leucyl aminopeptidase
MIINYTNKFDFKATNIAFFISEELNFKNNTKLSNLFNLKITTYLKKNKSLAEKQILSFDLTESQKCFFIVVNKKITTHEINSLGANFKNFINKNKGIKSVNIFSKLNFKLDNFSEDKFVNEFSYGFELKSYSFEKYLTKKNNNIQKLDLTVSNPSSCKKKYKYFSAVKEGIFLARDLVSEPPNILNPKRYTEEIKKLTKLGLKVEIFNEAKLKKLGMNALLGVGQGSKNETFLVIVKWNGAKNNFGKPLAFVGKGVCFDTGGISLKPAKFMEEMKYDMGGSAVVIGLLKSLALRKAKVNAVGVVGLVENMPDGNAQRPGDIVRSYSGKTIEVLNTDAEGRLVLADALTYTEEKFKPRFIIDLATLTGAIIMALGEEYAGLFSNNDELSDDLYKIGNEINEKVWRLPLHESYNKLINSIYADVQNINYAGGAGAITAAQFLQRFILKNTPWVHLDIAGMAFSKKAASLNTGGATGYGVRLLSELIKNKYEK